MSIFAQPIPLAYNNIIYIIYKLNESYTHLENEESILNKINSPSSKMLPGQILHYVTKI